MVSWLISEEARILRSSGSVLAFTSEAKFLLDKLRDLSGGADSAIRLPENVKKDEAGQKHLFALNQTVLLRFIYENYTITI